MSTARPYPAPGCPPEGPATGSVTITAAELAAEASADLDRAERAFVVARRQALDYAPKAPTEMLNEAVLRFGGYLLGSDFGAIRAETFPGDLGGHEYVVNHAAAWRNSGAAALLTKYKRRRAAPIKGGG